MSDADGRFIPLVEDDQGEGIKDFYDELPKEYPVSRPESREKQDEIDRLKDELAELLEKLNGK